MSRVKRLLFTFFLAALVLAGIETAGRIAYRINWGEPYAPRMMPRFDAPGEGAAPRPGFLEGQVRHPYYGFTLKNPYLQINRGRQDTGTGLFRVALTGGSVALNVRHALKDALQEELDRRSLPLTAKIDLYAMGGFKQPQQLMALSFALSTGMSFDAVVNLDGYNESVLPLSENYTRGVAPLFPRLWDVFVSRGGDPERAKIAYQADLLRGRLAALDSVFGSAPLRWSSVPGFFHRYWADSLVARIRLLTAGFSDRYRPEGIEQTGPVKDYPTADDAIEAMVNNWFLSSRLLAAAVDAGGARYFHFLQPNQYLPERKPFSMKEQQDCIDTASPQASIIPRVYPELIRRGELLESKGIVFTDLTGLFEETGATVYLDTCCHVNEHGNSLLAAAMVKVIASSW